MAAKGAPKPEGLFGLTLSEAKMIILGQICTDSSGKVDHDKLAIKGGYKNGASAYTVYRNAKRKLEELQFEESGTVNGGASSAATTPLKTPTRRKRAKAVDATPDDTPATPATPSGPGPVQADVAVTPKPKRVRKTPTKKAATPKVVPKAEELDSDGGSTMKLDSSPVVEPTTDKENHAVLKGLKRELSVEPDHNEENLTSHGRVPKKHLTASDEEVAMAVLDVGAEMDALDTAQVPVKTEE
ncbi:putative histone h1.3 [Aspergillus homomorphus CBS 101889]|uniref:Histone h1.3 n=1 Tax=Aspergillus homomorphus (strain CBS 101889) TaxID=1450537 RepID=A0A395I7N3_ASPHC|nr:hypothetical protein BO97DRAFT_440549 [Aspergillus homomorphus CBS 101889]RAL15955.1 hypothetical protein BO97DRAFT_440549 [Aspergillus homomorphus CBS 101889]